jgi:hypothetical protein
MDRLLEEIGKTVDLGTIGIQKGIEIIIKEVPQLVHQYITLQGVIAGINSIGLLLGLIILAVSSFFIIKKLTKIDMKYSDLNFIFRSALPLVIVVTNIAVIVSSGTIIYQNFIKFLYIMIAPKIFLIEQLSKLVIK